MPAYMRAFLSRHRALLVAILIASLSTLIPLVQSFVVSDGPWHGIPLPYGDEPIYYTHMKEVATGNFLFGSSYYLEHRHDPAVAILGSSILAALPMLIGIPLVVALPLNFLVWGALLIALAYALLRELGATKLVAASAALFLHLQSYDLVFRASVRQEIFPFLILFYLTLARFMKAPTRRNAAFLGVSSGISFYIYGFLWQAVVVALGVHFLYLLWARAWTTLKTLGIGYAVAAVIGAPPFLYTLWVAHHPLFWESARRFGVVVSHLPMGEVVYSGSWTLISIALYALIRMSGKPLRDDAGFRTRFAFLAITGFALFIHQVSNVVTGAHFEVGEHLRRFIIPWLALAFTLIAYDAWRVRTHLVSSKKRLIAVLLLVLAAANIWFAWTSVRRFMPGELTPEWGSVQLYAGPYAWLNEHEPEPVVVWGDPHNQSTVYLPAFTKHYVLHTEYGKLTLLSDEEFRERYLVSRYFEHPTAEDLMHDMPFFLGRADSFHEPMSRARDVKVCRVIRILVPGPDCGEIPTAVSLLGEPFFEGLVTKLDTEIRPNIETYLAKYHVRYILKDVVLDLEYEPESLGATKVYDDGRFELYRLPEGGDE